MAHGVFCVYIDGLLMRLCESKVGCWIGNVHVGVLAYADDLTLLAPTPRTMRFLLKKICEDYAREFHIAPQNLLLCALPEEKPAFVKI